MTIELGSPHLPELRDWVWTWLTPFQREAVTFAVSRRNALLWHACGAGKTADAILWSIAAPGPVIIVTRASARQQWANEVKRLTTVSPFVILPEASKRVGSELLCQYLARTSRIYLIMSWQSLRDENIFPYLMRLRNASVVWDEHHMLKNPKRWVHQEDEDGRDKFERVESMAARAARLAPRMDRRLGTTATPVPDRVRDLWAQLDTIEPGCMGKYWDFARKYCDAHEGPYGMIDEGASNMAELQEFLRPLAHIVKQDEINKLLPPLRRMTTELTIDQLNRSDAASNKAVKLAAKAAGGGKGSLDSVASTALLEAMVEQTASRKSKYIVERACEAMMSGQKVLVFTGRRRDVDILAEKIQKKLQQLKPAERNDINWRLWHAHGGTDAMEREVIRDQYMAWEGAGCIVGTGAAWGESVNLQETNLLIVAMLPWTWGQLRQWEGRVYRLGLTKAVTIEYVIALGSIDERINALVLQKLPIVESILPDEQVAGVRETLQGGSDEEVIEGLLDSIAGKVK